MSKFLDPFSVPAQLNNFGVLVVAYVAKQLNEETECIDESHSHFLFFIFYGTTLVCGGTFLVTVLYTLGIIDFCVNRICPCGQVCLTLNTLGIFLIGIIYHFVATIYGITQLIFGSLSECIQLQMFKRITGIIYLIWLLVILGFLGYVGYKRKMKNKLSTINERFINV